MKKLILRYLYNSDGDNVSFEIEEQTHRNNRFGGLDATGGGIFIAKNNVSLVSDSFPDIYDHNRISLYCHGLDHGQDHNIITVTRSVWEQIKEAVREYNEYNDYYGNCILGEIIENIVPMKMFIIE